MKHSPIITALIILTASPSYAACHRYSTWHYPYPQSCGIAHRAAEAHNWYVEITGIPDPVVEQLNKELQNPPASNPGTIYYKQPWITQCLKSGPPDLCEVAWEKLAASCATDPEQNVICDAPIPEPKQ